MKEYIESVIEDFNNRLFKNTLEHDSWLHLQTEDRTCSCHIDENEMETWLRNKLADAYNAGLEQAEKACYEVLPSANGTYLRSDFSFAIKNKKHSPSSGGF